MNFDQAPYDIKPEWALEGVEALREISDVIIVVDVLSFSTAVDVAVSRSATVIPFRWRDEWAKEFAAENQALLAANRGTLGEDLIGAGAVLAQLLSPEAEMAKAAFMHFRTNLRETIRSCGSGRELVEGGFEGDVDLASEYDVSSAAPFLAGDRFIDDGSV